MVVLANVSKYIYTVYIMMGLIKCIWNWHATLSLIGGTRWDVSYDSYTCKPTGRNIMVDLTMYVRHNHYIAICRDLCQSTALGLHECVELRNSETREVTYITKSVSNPSF